MLQPARTKFRKQHKGRIHGAAKGGTSLNFGQYGLKALEPERINAREIEAARRAITREMKRAGRVWIRVFPDRPVLEIEDHDPVFHRVYDLDQRYQISGQWSLRSGVPYMNGGADPHWRGIYDDKKRLVVAIWFNNDTGDSWEWADAPEYPERYSALGIRMAVNHVIYAMTH